MPVGQRVARTARGWRAAPRDGLAVREDQPGLLLRQGGPGRAEDPLEQLQRRGVDLLDHAGADDDRALVHARAPAAAAGPPGAPGSSAPGRAGRRSARAGVPGGEQPYGILVRTGPPKVRPGRLLGEEGVGDLCRPVRGAAPWRARPSGHRPPRPRPDSRRPDSARCPSRYSSEASQARSRSRGSSGKRVRVSSAQGVVIRSFIVVPG